MNKKIALILGGVVILIVVGIWTLNSFQPENSLSTPIQNQQKAVEITLSKTLKTHTDSAGFIFNYPDNLSLLNNQLKDDNTYAELQLTANGVNDSLVLKISDSKFKSLDEWVKKNNATETPKETKLGTLKALEVKVSNKLLLGALDQGIFFNIEIPLNENKDFWMEVYNKVIADFSFVSPAQDTTDQQSTVNFSSDEVTFEGEEVVQ